MGRFYFFSFISFLPAVTRKKLDKTSTYSNFVGYQDSGADIAYTLRSRGLVTVLTPTPSPTPTQQDGWCFADSEAGILEALERGATHLWANTVLFQAHPLQASATLKAREDEMWVVGQPPRLVEVFDDKAAANDWLRRRGKFTLPWCRVIDADSDLEKLVQDIGGQFPVIGKPIRGRGSYGVKRCDYVEQLKVHARTLLAQTSRMIVEEYLDGDEGTVTVMPPSPQRNEYWCLPLVVRFNHVDGVAPYNGVIAVTANSRAATQAEQNDPAVISILDQCKNIAELMGATAPIRIDVRRFKPGAEFALFDINMKPVSFILLKQVLC